MEEKIEVYSIPYINIYENDTLLDAEDIVFLDLGKEIMFQRKCHILQEDTLLGEIEKNIDNTVYITKSLIGCREMYLHHQLNKWIYNIACVGEISTSFGFDTKKEAQQFDKFIKSIL
jgi:hypothetical protein